MAMGGLVMIGTLLADLWPVIITLGGAVIAFLAAYFKGRSDASAKAEKKAAKKRADDLQTAKETRDEVDGTSDDDVRDELHKWNRH